MKNYIINDNTLAIIPKGNYSLIYEGSKEILVKRKPTYIIRKNCLFYGSTFTGRRKSTECITGNSYKLPIIINEKNKLIFFPTSSLRDKQISWINLNNIDFTYYDKKTNTSVIVFINKVILNFHVSLNILNNQIMKSTHLEHILIKNYDTE